LKLVAWKLLLRATERWYERKLKTGSHRHLELIHFSRGLSGMLNINSIDQL